ncbi:MAG: hypothetical protein DRR06_18805 [Gammaproteobacteria bacterium]|nr:MAG: hypothetical protein DRR06_18805 [Gammaproteobacteria bacterium]
MSEPSDTIRSRHRNVGGSCSRCIKPFGNSWQPVSWPCDVIVIREADRADAEKERADKTADVLAHVEDDLNALLCNGPEERVWLEYKHERDKLRNALTMSESAVKEFLGEATALTAERDAEKERADKAEAALAEMRPLYAAAGDDAWQRCIERDAAEADATALRGALWMVHQAFRPGGHPDHIPWSIVDETLAAHEARITKRDTPAKQGDPDGR